jgi:hypothetical protein
MSGFPLNDICLCAQIFFTISNNLRISRRIFRLNLTDPSNRGKLPVSEQWNYQSEASYHNERKTKAAFFVSGSIKRSNIFLRPRLIVSNLRNNISKTRLVIITIRYLDRICRGKFSIRLIGDVTADLTRFK